MAVQFFPLYFIPMASVATLLKAVSGMASGTVKANVNRHFASAVKGKNLGDITAKSQSQGVGMYVVGMFYGIGVSFACQHYETPLLLAANCILLSAAHLYCGYCSLKNLNVRFLNEQRGEIVMQAFLSNPSQSENVLPSPNDVREKEVFVSSYQPSCKITVGASISQLLKSSGDMETLLSHNRGETAVLENYLISASGGHVEVCLHKDATERDRILAFFQAQAFNHLSRENSGSGKDSSTLLKESYALSVQQFPRFLTDLESIGWDTSFILLRQPSDMPQFTYN
jgi:hypothetical protein